MIIIEGQFENLYVNLTGDFRVDYLRNYAGSAECGVYCGEQVIGYYKTYNRALEVYNEIKQHIQDIALANIYGKNIENVIYTMPQDKED